MRKIATALAGVLVIATLSACPARNPAPRPSSGGPTIAAPAGILSVTTVEDGAPCPAGFHYQIIGSVRDPSGRPVDRPMQMVVNQVNRDGEAGSVIEDGHERPGLNYGRTGRSPMTHCIMVNPGDYVHVIATFTIQTNAVGWKVQCVARAWGIQHDSDEDAIPPGGSVQLARATCVVQGVAG